MKNPKVSLILPCYNEEEHFIKSVEKILIIMKYIKNYEVIFVEDKSIDGTKELVQTIIKNLNVPNIRGIYHDKNLGRGKCVNDGIINAKGQYVGFIDIDCEISPNYIPVFVDNLKKGFDVVCGERKYKVSFSGLIRAMASKFYGRLVQFILKTNLKDTEAGFKFFNKRNIIPILKKVKDNGWFWDTEIMIRSQISGLKIKFIPVIFKRRNDKTSTVNIFNDTFLYLQKLFKFRHEINSNYRKYVK